VRQNDRQTSTLSSGLVTTVAAARANTALVSVIASVLLRTWATPISNSWLYSAAALRRFTWTSYERASSSTLDGVYSTRNVALTHWRARGVATRVSANFLRRPRVAHRQGRCLLTRRTARRGPPLSPSSAPDCGAATRRQSRHPGSTANAGSAPYTIVGILPTPFAFTEAGSLMCGSPGRSSGSRGM